MKHAAFCLIALCLITSRALALDAADAVHFDIVTIDPETLSYDEEDRTQLMPTRAFVNIINFHPMSDDNGNRYALVTLQNQLRTRTVLEKENFVGIFANGRRSNPIACDETLDPAIERSTVLRFGSSKFPLVKIIIDNGEK